MAESHTSFLGHDDSLGSTIQGLEKRLDGFGQSLVNIEKNTSMLPQMFARGAAAVAGFAASVAGTIVSLNTFNTALDFVEKLNNLKAATGATGAELILLQRAFDLTGSSADKVGPAINKVQEVIARAGEGAPKAIEKLNLLGLSLGQLQNLSPAEQMERVMRAINAIPDPAERARAAMAIFGHTLGRELLPLIRGFDGEMAKAAATLGSLPRIIETYGPSMTMFGNAIDALKKKPEEFAVGVVGPLSTLLGNLAERFANFDAAGFGEAIGTMLNEALIEMLIWVERGYQVLQGVWLGMKDAALPIIQEVGAAFTAMIETISPYVQNIVNFFNNIDYTAIGRRLGEQFSYALDVVRGLWANPEKIFGLYGTYLDYTFRNAADSFVSLFVTAIEALGRAFISLWNSDIMASVAKIFSNALILAIAQLGIKMIDMVEATMRFWTSLWDSITSGGVSNFAARLFDMITSFGKDFYTAITNPIAFISGKFASALIEGSQEGADRFKTDFDAATGSLTERMRSGFEGMSQEAAQNIGEGFSEAGSKLTDAVRTAVTETEGFKSNIFGSAEAGERLKAATDALAENGRALRENVDSAAQSMTDIKSDASQVVDFYTGPSGVAESAKDAAAKTKDAGETFSRRTEAAGRSFEASINNSMTDFASAARGFASDTTLREAVSELRSIAQKLPQPALTA